MSPRNSTSKHRIAFCAEGCTLRIVPGHTEVEVGDWVTFHNLHSGPANVLIPNTELFGKTMIIPLDGGAKSSALRVLKGASGCYPFAVYDPVSRQFGHASLPIIIVYPKQK